MTCSFCGRAFTEEGAQKECRGCALLVGCRNVRCPYCGYETPRVPGFIRKLLGRREKIQ